jgi:Helicase HerA, central domain
MTFEESDAKAERVAVLSSPSSTTDLAVDVLGHSADKRLVGAMTYFTFRQDGRLNCALGQVTDITLRNQWVEGATMRTLIRDRARVDPLTERQDTHLATVTVGAVFCQKEAGFEQSQMGTVPATGTAIKLVGNDLVDSLLGPYSDVMCRIGRFYGNETLFPAWFRHFGPGRYGTNEAYHLGIFGKTGSGKSVLAQILLCGYAVHPEMSIFVMDPQGEFFRNFAPGTPARQLIEGTFGREVLTLNAKDIWLVDSRYRLFLEILSRTPFFSTLTIVAEENRERARAVIAKAIEDYRLPVTGKAPAPWEVQERGVFDAVWATLGEEDSRRAIYTSDSTFNRLTTYYNKASPDEMYDLWARTARLFSNAGRKGARKITEIVDTVLDTQRGRVVVIDLSEENAPTNFMWDEGVKLVVLRTFLQALRDRAEAQFRLGKRLNTLVLIDEAHRFAPRDLPEDDFDRRSLRALLVDSARTTRKYGLGWGFISQTLSSIDRELSGQLRIYVFGYGLAWGSELRALEELMGGSDAIRLYQSFRDPETSLGERQYPFMVTGPLSPLSFSGAPLFFTALRWPDEVVAQLTPKARARQA